MNYRTIGLRTPTHKNKYISTSDCRLIIIIIIKNEKIRVTLCENAAGALYIVNKNIALTSKHCAGGRVHGESVKNLSPAKIV